MNSNVNKENLNLISNVNKENLSSNSNVNKENLNLNSNENKEELNSNLNLNENKEKQNLNSNENEMNLTNGTNISDTTKNINKQKDNMDVEENVSKQKENTGNEINSKQNEIDIKTKFINNTKFEIDKQTKRNESNKKVRISKRKNKHKGKEFIESDSESSVTELEDNDVLDKNIIPDKKENSEENENTFKFKTTSYTGKKHKYKRKGGKSKKIRTKESNNKNNNKSSDKNTPNLNSVEFSLKEPRNYKDILNMSDKNEWLEAVDNELMSMHELNVFTDVKNVPKGTNIISPKWVFKYKYDLNGNLAKRKARLVARGFTQKEGIDFDETFSPTLKQKSLRIITSIAAQQNYNIHQLDIKTAYLNADLNETIYIKVPEGYNKNKNGFWKLNKALYGLRQSGRAWNDKLNDTLLELGFKRLISDPCVYTKTNKENKIVCILGVYVDDILLTGEEEEILKTKELLSKNFKLTDLGYASYIIGIRFEKCEDGYLLHQRKYLDDILDRFNMKDCKPVSTPKAIYNASLRKKPFNSTKYRQAIGSLLYLAISTRPDILFSVTKASRKATNPNLEDWENVKRIMKYLKGNPNYGIKYTNEDDLKIYVDADYGGDKETRRSTTGILVKIGNGSTSWFSQLQKCITLSTFESEYYAIVECAKEALWYKNIFSELGIKVDSLLFNVDNQATIHNCKNETINPKSKHIDLRYHKIKELVKSKIIDLKYIKSQMNLADGFTKYLSGPSMTKFRNNILTKF